MLAMPLLALLAIQMGCAKAPAADDDAPKTVKRAEKNFKLQVFDNATSMGRVSGVNNSGAVIGMREVGDERNLIFTQYHFYQDDAVARDMPTLEGYTNTEPEALSDSGLVVGFASRPIRHPGGSLTAVVWDPITNELTNLGRLPDDMASHAFDIDAAGKRICGYSTGAEPPRMRPCVWTRETDDGEWKIEALPTEELYNPFLLGGRVIISPDGNTIAACVTEDMLPNLVCDSGLFLWKFKDGTWQRSQISSEQYRLRDMNNAGQIVGDLSIQVKRLPVTISPDGTETRIELLPDDFSGEAFGINDEGIVVGLSDDPPGGDEGGPQAFVWRDGKTTPLEMLEATSYSAALAINDHGQIGGFADITFPDQVIKDPETDESEPLVKTLGILWTPNNPKGK